MILLSKSTPKQTILYVSFEAGPTALQNDTQKTNPSIKMPWLLKYTFPKILAFSFSLVV